MYHRVAVLGFALSFSVASSFTAFAAPAAKLNSEAFIAACVADDVITGQPGLEEGSKVTPQQFCECVAGKFQEKKASQTDVDMLTKMHKDAITDDDAANYATLEDLLSANEGYEDACKTSLGLPVNTNDDEEAPAEDDTGAPEEEIPPPE